MAKQPNPFRPGAGHMPPYLAGRQVEMKAFSQLLQQEVILENWVLTGLRGVGKTVLLDQLKPVALKAGWLWVGADLSETTSLTEANIATRMITDLAVVTSSLSIAEIPVPTLGYHAEEKATLKLTFDVMTDVYERTPGLSADKLKAVLNLAWSVLSAHAIPGVVFAYDEAQNMSDHAMKEQYPLSLMLDVFQSLQKQGVMMMLVMCGLPTLFPKLVEARTFAERMFRVELLDRLTPEQSREAIEKPVEQLKTKMTAQSVELVIHESGGYPYFIQFMCREIYDIFLSRIGQNEEVPIDQIISKLDTDFFAGRWAKVTDRERELLMLIAQLPTSEQEFTISEIIELSQQGASKPFGASRVSQMLAKLANAGLVYKNRHGRYAFAVPLLGRFIKRQAA